MLSHHRSKIAGLVLAAAGLMILGSHGPGAGAAPSEAKVPVAGKVGFVSAPAATVSLLNGAAPGAPGDTVSASVSMTVESNKAYTVTATPQASALTSTTTSDSILASELKTTDSTGAAADFGAAVKIVETTAKSAAPSGDTYVSPLSMTVPWVEPGEYTISIEYTVAQL